MDRLLNFLAAVKSAGWRASNEMPPVWNAELREAMSDNFIKIGFGGSIELTKAGREALAANKP